MNVVSAQKEIDEVLQIRIWDKIRDLKIQDKIHAVEMQGSYAKGTDLPSSGSDLDLFIIFKTNTPLKLREKYGLEIGLHALKEYNPMIKDATSKYVESFFTYHGYNMEVQIVQTRHLTLEQIHSKILNDESIKIGMERTPHQTRFMKKVLVNKKEEVKELKQWFKDAGLYDSSMKSQGFSGYSIECLIYYLHTFDDVISFFTNLKKGESIGNGDRNINNIFSLIDPIDPNRDLVSAFSDIKIGKTVETCKYFKRYGKLPKQNIKIMDAVSLTYNTTEENYDTLAGQIRKTQYSIISQLNKLGFMIPTTREEINNFVVDDIPIKINVDGKRVTMIFGMYQMEIPLNYKDGGVPLFLTEFVEDYKNANKGLEFVEEDNKLKAIKKRKFTHVMEALTHLTTTGLSSLQKTGVTNDMKSSPLDFTMLRDVEFESLV